MVIVVDCGWGGNDSKKLITNFTLLKITFVELKLYLSSRTEDQKDF